MDRDQFLANHQKYHLGILPTEQPHPKTVGLSHLAQTNLPKAIESIKAIDLEAVDALRKQASQIESLREKASEVLESGGRIFLCGCGATGRLSLLIEYLWREKYNTDQVVAFMAGGDVALVHSLEGFEDYPDLGARHLRELGFSSKDLLISSTEGGETPYVIGATLEAAKISQHSPWFLFCNPKDVLIDKIERSAEVINNSQIKKICLFSGPMALSGSTRMQASTVLQLALGYALIEVDSPVLSLIDEFSSELKNCKFSALAPFIEKEHNIYENNEFLMYMPRHFGITVFTDTTERSPTFSLPSFENDKYEGDQPSLCYILFPKAENKAEAWQQLLKRAPHALNWSEIDHQTSNDYLESFNFCKTSMEAREKRLGDVRQHLFEIDLKKNQLLFSLNGIEGKWALSTERSLLRHTMVKLLLNTHSTLLMGRMNRYQSNIMTWVRPTNAKLVDRAARYVDHLLTEQGQKVDYLKIVNRIYDLKSELNSGGSIVLEVYKSLVDTSLKPQGELV